MEFIWLATVDEAIAAALEPAAARPGSDTRRAASGAQ
jgi:hypothetical protein